MGSEMCIRDRLNVCRYIACFLWAALHSVGLGYVVTGILYRGLCPDAVNDPSFLRQTQYVVVPYSASI